MKIGELAQRSGTAVVTVRFYEREGLLPPPARTSGNYRVYEPSHEERLSFIRHCRSLDMTLDEIRQLLHFKDAPDERCDEVNELLDQHIEHVSRRIRELKRLQGQLKALREQCGHSRAAADCGILRGLSASVETEPMTSHVDGSHDRTSGKQSCC